MKSLYLKYAVILIILITGVIFLFYHMEFIYQFKDHLEKNVNYGLFILLMAVLPALGFPVSAFLVLSGIRFGIFYGLVSMAITYPVHLVLTYIFTRSFLRPYIDKFLKKRNYKIPEVSEKRKILYTSFFTAIPSLPYAVKNYLMALSGVSLPLFFGVVLPIHIAAGIPFVVLGESVISFGPLISIILICAIILGNLILYLLGEKNR